MVVDKLEGNANIRLLRPRTRHKSKFQIAKIVHRSAKTKHAASLTRFRSYIVVTLVYFDTLVNYLRIDTTPTEFKREVTETK